MTKQKAQELRVRLGDAIYCLISMSRENYFPDKIKSTVDLLRELSDDFIIIRKAYVEKQIRENLIIQYGINAKDAYRVSTTFGVKNFMILPKEAIDENKEMFIEYTINEIKRVLETELDTKSE